MRAAAIANHPLSLDFFQSEDRRPQHLPNGGEVKLGVRSCSVAQKIEESKIDKIRDYVGKSTGTAQTRVLSCYVWYVCASADAHVGARSRNIAQARAAAQVYISKQLTS